MEVKNLSVIVEVTHTFIFNIQLFFCISRHSFDAEKRHFWHIQKKHVLMIFFYFSPFYAYNMLEITEFALKVMT